VCVVLCDLALLCGGSVLCVCGVVRLGSFWFCFVRLGSLCGGSVHVYAVLVMEICCCS